jgi:hypothetical protein
VAETLLGAWTAAAALVVVNDLVWLADRSAFDRGRLRNMFAKEQFCFRFGGVGEGQRGNRKGLILRSGSTDRREATGSRASGYEQLKPWENEEKRKTPPSSEGFP